MKFPKPTHYLPGNNHQYSINKDGRLVDSGGFMPHEPKAEAKIKSKLRPLSEKPSLSTTHNKRGVPYHIRKDSWGNVTIVNLRTGKTRYEDDSWYPSEHGFKSGGSK